MKTEIITIGDEILVGQTVDTNSAWLGQALNAIGMDVHRIVSISDTVEAITSALDLAMAECQLVLITGGLGPTRDDVTKTALCRYFDDELVMNQEILGAIEKYFASLGKTMLDVNRVQAALPSKCRVIVNKRGTASGMWFEKSGKVVISMPGVPFEMKGMMQDEILSLIKERFEAPPVVHRTIMTQGVGESYLAETIKVWENELRDAGLGLAYLPSPGIVKLRITVRGMSVEEAKAELDNRVKNFMILAGQFVFGVGDITLPEAIGRLLKEKGLKLAIAESCTGGAIGASIVSVPGSSEYFAGGVVAYSYEMKEKLLGVRHDDLLKHGAVSSTIAEQMAEGVRMRTGADFSLATTGIAGPGGGLQEKPVGTVWIALSSKKNTVSRKFQFGRNRGRNIEMTGHAALFMLYREILQREI